MNRKFALAFMEPGDFIVRPVHPIVEYIERGLPFIGAVDIADPMPCRAYIHSHPTLSACPRAANTALFDVVLTFGFAGATYAVPLYPITCKPAHECHSPDLNLLNNQNIEKRLQYEKTKNCRKPFVSARRCSALYSLAPAFVRTSSISLAAARSTTLCRCAHSRAVLPSSSFM